MNHLKPIASARRLCSFREGKFRYSMQIPTTSRVEREHQDVGDTSRVQCVAFIMSPSVGQDLRAKTAIVSHREHMGVMVARQYVLLRVAIDSISVDFLDDG